MLKRSSLTLWAAAVVVVFVWSSAFAGIRAGLAGYSPSHLAVLRFVVASIAMAVYAAFGRFRLPSRHDLLYFLLLGFLGFTFYNLALNTGEVQIAAGPAALLVQTGPIWTALLAVLFLGERLRMWGWLGIAISFLGALVIALGKWGDLSLSWAAALILLAAFSSSAYSIIQKRLLARYRPVELTAYAIWGGTLLLLPFAGGILPVMHTAPLASTLAIVYLGIFPAALAYAAWAYVLSRLPASRAVSILYGVPVMAFLVGWVWLGEAPRMLDIVGGLLALSGVLVVNTLGRVRPSVTGH